MDASEMSQSEGNAARDRVGELPFWFHSIDLGGGVVTPGMWSTETQLPIRKAFEAIDFRGKKVLDVGCLDGLWSFEAERRGAAEVHSIDVLPETAPGRESYFELAAEALGSKAHYHPYLSVFDVAKLGVDDFDIVLYLGVHYHLKDPLLALARLRQVMKEGAILLDEGQVIDSDKVYAEFFYRRWFSNDGSNWWVPSIPCLREWIESAFFDIEEEYRLFYMPWGGLDNTGRYIVRARAVRRADPQLTIPEPELRAFDLNRYVGDSGNRDAMGNVIGSPS
jgi:tRNA (mo5U34)-methyltransferase